MDDGRADARSAIGSVFGDPVAGFSRRSLCAGSADTRGGRHYTAPCITGRSADNAPVTSPPARFQPSPTCLRRGLRRPRARPVLLDDAHTWGRGAGAQPVPPGQAAGQLLHRPRPGGDRRRDRAPARAWRERRLALALDPRPGLLPRARRPRVANLRPVHGQGRLDDARQGRQPPHRRPRMEHPVPGVAHGRHDPAHRRRRPGLQAAQREARGAHQLRRCRHIARGLPRGPEHGGRARGARGVRRREQRLGLLDADLEADQGDRPATRRLPGVRHPGGLGRRQRRVRRVRRDVKASVDAARAGGGPQFVECKTYRMGGHAAHDKYESYMPMEVLAEWSDKDPIKRARGRPARGARDLARSGSSASASGFATRCARRSSRPRRTATRPPRKPTSASSPRRHRHARADLPRGDQRRPPRRDGGRPARVLHGRGRRPPGRGVRRHEGAAAGLRRAPLDRHAGRRGGHRGRRDRRGDGRPAPRRRDAVRRLRLDPPSTRS